MPNDEIIIITKLKALLARFSFKQVVTRLSTILAVVSAMAASAAAAFIAMPGQWQADFPAWAGQAFAFTAVVSAALVPLATSFKQQRKA